MSARGPDDSRHAHHGPRAAAAASPASLAAPAAPARLALSAPPAPRCPPASPSRAVPGLPAVSSPLADALARCRCPRATCRRPTYRAPRRAALPCRSCAALAVLLLLRVPPSVELTERSQYHRLYRSAATGSSSNPHQQEERSSSLAAAAAQQQQQHLQSKSSCVNREAKPDRHLAIYLARAKRRGVHHPTPLVPCCCRSRAARAS
jgi:hypothetical protein